VGRIRKGVLCPGAATAGFEKTPRPSNYMKTIVAAALICCCLFAQAQDYPPAGTSGSLDNAGGGTG